MACQTHADISTVVRERLMLLFRHNTKLLFFLISCRNISAIRGLSPSLNLLLRLAVPPYFAGINSRMQYESLWKAVSLGRHNKHTTASLCGQNSFLIHVIHQRQHLILRHLPFRHNKQSENNRPLWRRAHSFAVVFFIWPTEGAVPCTSTHQAYLWNTQSCRAKAIA